METETLRPTIEEFLADEDGDWKGYDEVVRRIAFEVCTEIFFGPHDEPVHDEMLSAALRKRCRQQKLHLLNARGLVHGVMNFLARKGGAVQLTPDDFLPFLKQEIDESLRELSAAHRIFLAKALHERLHRGETLDADAALDEVIDMPLFQDLNRERVAAVLRRHLDFLCESGALSFD